MAAAKRKAAKGSPKPVSRNATPEHKPQVFPLHTVFVLLTLGLYYYVPFPWATLSDLATSPLDTVKAILHLQHSSSTGTHNGKLQLTDGQLREYDGTDREKPIYVALNGTIFDATSGWLHYGPGGSYHHFAGRDATRAWVTTCFEPEDQLAYDMRGVEEMFTTKWLDEEIEAAAGGKSPQGGMVNAPKKVRDQALKALKRIGSVSIDEKRKRREADKEQAAKGIEDAIGHWMSFFKSHEQYKEVGKVVGRKAPSGTPPALCESARMRRPVKGGLMGNVADAQGSAGKSK